MIHWNAPYLRKGEVKYHVDQTKIAQVLRMMPDEDYICYQKIAEYVKHWDNVHKVKLENLNLLSFGMNDD